MKALRRILLIMVMLVAQFSLATSVAASSINIDGNFNDWNSISKTSVSSNFYSEVAFVQSGNMLYMYAKENGTNSWEKYFSNTQPTLILNDNTEVHLVITEKSSAGDNSTLEVRLQNGYTVIDGSKGKRVKKGTYMYELAIPVDEWRNIKSVRINTDYSTTQTFQVKSLEPTTKQPTTKQPTTKQVTTKQVTTKQPTTKQQTTAHIITTKGQSGNIVIDGHYEDWSGYPHSLLTNWNMPMNERTEQNCRSVSLVVDDENIYFHVKMISGWTDVFNGNEFTISVGDYKVTIELRYEDDMPIPGGAHTPGIHHLKVIYKNRVPGHEDMAIVEGADAMLTIINNKPDEAEVLIPKEVFHLLYDMDIRDIREVTLANPNLFDQPVSSSATPTYPYVGIALCILSVVLVLAIMTIVRKRKALGNK